MLQASLKNSGSKWIQILFIRASGKEKRDKGKELCTILARAGLSVDAFHKTT